MFTSYYANKKVVNPVSISSKVPDWFVGNWYKKLAPPIRPNIVLLYKGGRIDSYKYTEMYHELVLDKLNCKDVYDEICSLYGDDATLLCYERPSEFCHRHLVAAWFNKNLNADVTEFGIMPQKRLF